MEKRVCKKCGVEKDITEFYKSKGIREHGCKECKSKKVMDRYNSDSEFKKKMLDTNKKWYANNKKSKNEVSNVG